MVNRKLIRTTLAEVRERADREPSGRRAASDNRKRVPPEQTHAESFYYKKQMDNKTPMVVVLQDGEVLRGVIEWYDRNCLKLHRSEGPNLLVLKHNVKYIYKADEERMSSREAAERDYDEVATVETFADRVEDGEETYE